MHTFLCVPLSRPIGGHKKTFEELLEEQLRLEEQRLKSARQQQVRVYYKGLRKANHQSILKHSGLCSSKQESVVLKLPII